MGGDEELLERPLHCCHSRRILQQLWGNGDDGCYYAAAGLRSTPPRIACVHVCALTLVSTTAMPV